MFCQKCGAELSGDTLFCPKCGERAEKPSEENTASEFDDTIVMKPIELPSDFALSDKLPQKRMPSSENTKSVKPKKSVQTNNDNNDKNEKNNNQKYTIVLLSVLLGIMLTVIIIFSFKLSYINKKNDLKSENTISDVSEKKSEKIQEKKDADEEEKKDKDEEKEQNKAPDSYSTIPVDMIYASTERTEDDIVFSASNATDSKLSTAWSPENYAGAGESITLCFNSKRKVHGIKIANGYSADGEEYSLNSRVKNVTVKFADGNICTAELKDGMLSMQTIDFGQEFTCRSLTVYIDSVYADEDIKPVYISEIEVF